MKDVIVLESPLTVHEATVHLRGLLETEFGDAANVKEQASSGRTEICAKRDWSDTVQAFRLVLTLQGREGGSYVTVSTQASLGSLIGEIAIAACACGVLVYKTGVSVVSLLVVTACAIGLPLVYRDHYRSERDRLRTRVARLLDAS